MEALKNTYTVPCMLLLCVTHKSFFFWRAFRTVFTFETQRCHHVWMCTQMNDNKATIHVMPCNGSYQNGQTILSITPQFQICLFCHIVFWCMCGYFFTHVRNEKKKQLVRWHGLARVLLCRGDVDDRQHILIRMANIS